MPPPLPLFTLARTLSTVARGGDRTVLDPLRQRLTGAGTMVADLRDLGAAMVDELPDGFLRGLMQPAHPHPPAPRDPPMVALPEGCAAATVNRFLREMPGTECLSAAGIDPRGEPIHIPPDTALRLFETTSPHPPLRNAGDVPVLLRTTPGASTVVPAEPPEHAPDARLAVVASLRRALCDDDCQLELPQTAAFREMQRRLNPTLDALRARLPAGKKPSAAPDADEQRTLRAALCMVPRELLSAPAAIAAQDLLRRLAADGRAARLDHGDLGRITRLFIDQWDVACPVRGSFRPSRPPKALVTLARLQRWAWPDAFYAKPQAIDKQQAARGHAAKCLRADWDSRYGFDRALRMFAESGLPLPDVDLLYRMGVLPVEVEAAQQRSRRVSFAALPPAGRSRTTPAGTDGAGGVNSANSAEGAEGAERPDGRS